MNRLLRTAILIVAAMAGSALVLATLIGLVTNLTALGKSPADFVQKTDIKAVLHHPSYKTLKEFPTVKSLDLEGIEAIALFTEGNALFRRSALKGNESIGPYSVQVSDERIRALIDHHQKPLSADTNYRTLEQHQASDDHWTYLSPMKPLENGSLLTRILRAILFAKNTGVALIHNTDGIVIRHIEKSNPENEAVIHIPDMADAFIRISMGNGKKSLLDLQKNLHPEDALIFEGILGTSLLYFEEGMSFSYELLPLLEQPSSIQMSATGGTLTVLLSGSMNEVKPLQGILERLHIAFANTLQTSKITKRILDKRFSSIDIRHSAEMIERDQYKKDGWLVQETHQAGSQKGLVTAVHDNQFLMSTTASAIEHAIAHQHNLDRQKTNVRESVTTIAEVDLSQIHHLLPYLPITQEDISLRFGTGTLKFASSHNGILRSISIGSPENPLHLLDLLP